MIPKPPFPWEISTGREVAEFERLKKQLVRFWAEVFPRDESEYTSVVVPSLTLDPGELSKLPGAAFYEERLLFLLIRLRNPLARLVYVTSQPIPAVVLDYYLQLLAGVPAAHARARLTLLCAHDGSSRPLTEKILARPRLIERIRVNIADRERAYLTVFNSTPLERRLAVLLGIPLNAADPTLVHLGSKSEGRRVFRGAGVAHPAGREDVRDEEDAVEALEAIQAERPGLHRAVVKLNHSFSGEGNAIVELEGCASASARRAALRGARFATRDESAEAYLEKLARMGGVVEELLEAPGSSSPSVQLRINPRGECFVSSTHEQILGGPTGQIYLGCSFPAREAYRRELHEAGLRIARTLASRGVVSRLSVDFLAREAAGGGWTLSALEINLRWGGTTHPMLALRFLTEGKLDPGSGLFLAPDGAAKYYRATDGLASARYEGLLPEDLVEILTVNHLEYSWRSATGVLFHMIGALSEHGKLGLVAIGNSVEEAQAAYRRTIQVLDHETRFRAPGGPPPAGEA
jgi:hypothetical protein